MVHKILILAGQLLRSLGVAMIERVSKLLTVSCPKCRTDMVLATIVPHPVANQMERQTYFCNYCNKAKTYMLPTERSAPALAAS